MATVEGACSYSSVPGLKLRSWPGEETVAVFTPGSVKTHLISALAGEVLLLATNQPMTAAALAAALLSDAVSGTEVPAVSHVPSMPAASPHNAEDVPENAAEDTQATDAVHAVVDGLVQAGLLLRQPCA
jgi:hypothetical protein